MGLICKMKGHKWDGCRCRRCMEIRNEGHFFRNSSLVCVKCGGIRRQKSDKCICCGKSLNENRAMDVPVGVCNDCRKRAYKHYNHLLLELPPPLPKNPRHRRLLLENNYNNDHYYVCLNCGWERIYCEEGKMDYSDYQKNVCPMEEIRNYKLVPHFLDE